MSQQPIQLDPLVVQVREVPLRKLSGGPDKMFVQTDGAGNVLVDFADGVHEWGKSLVLDETQYEALRQEAFRRELADLEDIPTYRELYPSSRSGGTTTTPNGNTLGRVNGETPASAKAANDANPRVESESPAEGLTGDEILDGIQLGLDIFGLIPVVGEIADVANAGISLGRGDYAGAALSLLSAIPFGGYLGTAGKLVRRGTKTATEASAKVAEEGTGRAAKEILGKATEVGSGSTGAKVLGDAKAVRQADPPSPPPKGISAELYRKLRARTPSREAQAMVNKDVKLPLKDPALPGLTISKPLHADHIVPMKQITEMKGFNKLTFEQQIQVLNHKPNFHGLSETANTSRGAKNFSEWTTYKKGGIDVDASFRSSMIERAKKSETELQEMITSLLKEK
ncbi:hypothetical protein [Pseudomonas parafulva]|uniref:hypothetical protein n=1 Tax=Pseudomonas parafulva TaxID=157782 RepID=UPI000405F4A3|nr:hypothetical protein [Pseudomonas parafulva]